MGVIVGVAGGVLLLVTLTGLFVAGQGRKICMLSSSSADMICEGVSQTAGRGLLLPVL